MSIIKGFAISGISGHAAKLIFYSQFGQQLMRSMPSGYTDKNSVIQQNQRYAKFLPSVILASLLQPYVKILYAQKALTRTAFSQCIMQLAIAFAGTKAAPTYSPSLTVLGNGDIPQTNLLTAVKTTIDSITVTWPVTMNSPLEHSSDTMDFIITNLTGSVAQVVTTGATRVDGTCIIDVEKSLAGAPVFVSNPHWVSSENAEPNELASKVKLSWSTNPVDLL